MHMHKRGPTSAPNQAEVISLALMTKSTNHNDFLNRFQEKKKRADFLSKKTRVVAQNGNNDIKTTFGNSDNCMLTVMGNVK